MNLFTKIGLCLIIILGITVGALLKNRYQLRQALVEQSTNLKSVTRGIQVYKDKNNELHTVVIQQIKRIQDIKNTKDIETSALNEQLKQANIKLKNVTQVGEVITRIVYVSQPVSISKKSLQDTTITFGQPPFITNSIILKGDSLGNISATNNLEITNKQSLVWASKRETIDPPKRFFLCRWFQKRQTLTYVDIKNSNPFIITDKQTFTIITK